MRVFLLGMFIQALIVGILHGAVEFDPSLLEPAKSTWEKTGGPFVGENYVDYRYNGRVVFRLLDRFVPAMSSLISQAMKVNGTLELKNPHIVFFDSEKLLEDNFAVVAPSEEDRQVTIDPRALQLDELSRCFKNQYFIKLGPESGELEVNRKVYQELFLAKNVAIVENKFLKIRLDNLANSKHRNCVKLVDMRRNNSENCDICMERTKAIMFEPCNHILACEVCAPQIVDSCPSCRGNITGRRRVYL